MKIPLQELKTPFSQGQDRFIKWMLRKISKLERDNEVNKHNIRRHEDIANLKTRVPAYLEYSEDAE